MGMDTENGKHSAKSMRNCEQGVDICLIVVMFDAKIIELELIQKKQYNN